ncbi:hypothetical protein ABZS29_20740 [Kribbella sp. NPDC005582]|uniref:Acg family FMN-binding oxidoreductase n=1 Tax=Kribbella sp. NPDC005582 TaxID=3156893 RepID=UPI0033B260E4
MTYQLPEAHIRALLEAAIAAPSMHNTQPWRFEVEGHVIDVYLDGSRMLPAEDPTGRAMRIAAGAATFNLRCTAESLGYSTWFGLAPYAEEPDLLARIVVEPTGTSNEELSRLARQVQYRHTDRHPSDATPLAHGLRVGLTLAAHAEGAQLNWLTGEDVEAVRDLIREADLLEIHDWHRRTERAHWVGGTRAADGIPSAALGPRSSTYPAVVRDMASSPTDRMRPETVFEDHAEIAVLSTEHDDPADQVVAGIALERVLLTATGEGVSASFLNQPLEFEDLRRRVQRLSGLPGFAHMIIRFSHSRPPTTTGRRPIGEFLG